MKIDKRFNRIISRLARVPMADLGAKGIGNHRFEGFVKCKLAHGLGYSLIVPDQVFLGPKGTKWLQPLAFGPNVVGKLNDHDIRCSFNIDISGGHRLAIRFSQNDLREQFEDGSELYECSIEGPLGLAQFATGRSFYNPGSAPKLELFHHTSIEAKKAILSGGEFRSSKWNIQGTTKQLTNVGYVYFTPVPTIEHPDDLKMIAMASDGQLHFSVDNFQPPSALLPGWEAKFADKILVLPVYRASTKGRTESLAFWIETTALAPQHIWRHAPDNDHAWYEVCNPFIQRVGLLPDRTLRFTSNEMGFADIPHKRFDYLVIGDARTVTGLAAPYDEEDTTYILKVERGVGKDGILSFWFSHANTELYANRDVELQDFGSK